MYISKQSPSPVQPADLVIRPKSSGVGFHYGTGVGGGLVAHKTPERGKHLARFEEFQDGKPARIVRFNRTPLQKAIVEYVALSDLGDPWAASTSNCEHDATRAQTGVAYSPTVNGVALGIGGFLVYFLLKDMFSSRN